MRQSPASKESLDPATSLTRRAWPRQNEPPEQVIDVPRRYRRRQGRQGRWPALWHGGEVILGLAIPVALYAAPATLAALVIGGAIPAGGVPVEVVLAAALVAAWPGGAVLHAAAGALTALLLLTALDAATQAVLGRPFLLVFDLPLAASAAEFVAETYGIAVAIFAAGAAFGVLLSYGLIAFGLGRVRGAAQRGGWMARALVLLACGAILAMQLGHRIAPDRVEPVRFVSDRSVRTLVSQARAVAVRLAHQSSYRAPVEAPARPPVGLGGADVLLFFLESYGRSSIGDPRYGATIVPSLRGVEDVLRARGFSAVSGWLESPTLGGQSWLAHASLLSGLRVDSEFRYRLLLSGERRTLVGDFAAAGYRAVLLAPAIDRPWPEVAFYGFDRTYFSRDMGYAGPRYGWVTMPDQYTLAFLDRAERRRQTGGPPLFAVTVLISGHAPWTPVAEVVEDWSDIGDGRIFAAWADRGEPPQSVWRDPEKVRRQYAHATGYVIDVLGSYFRQFGDDRRTLVLLLGDHQPGPIVSGTGAGLDVPIHAVSNDPDLLRPFKEWGFVDGMVPAPDGAARPMEAFRDRFLASFASEGEEKMASEEGDAAAQGE